MTLPLIGACGQKGDLFIPSGAAAEQRATLPQAMGMPSTSTTTTVSPAAPMPAASTPPVTGTASPVRQP